MDYCTIEQLTGEEGETTGYLPNVTSDEDKAKLAEIITRSSRRIDAFVTEGRAENFFAAAAAEPSALIVYGDGLSFLTLPEFVPGSVASVTGLAGVEIEDFVERGSGLQLTDSAGSITRGCVFGEGVAYTVTARWGVAATPADIVEACLQLSVRTYRKTDEGFSGVIGDIQTASGIIERPLPTGVKEMLDVHRRRYRSRRLTFA